MSSLSHSAARLGSCRFRPLLRGLRTASWSRLSVAMVDLDKTRSLVLGFAVVKTTMMMMLRTVGLLP